MPKISIIMPFYNHVHYLKKSVGSIMNQTYRDFEFIIVDDGSPIDRRAEIEQMKAQSPVPFTYIRQENKGPGGARNTGIRSAKGEIFAFLDQDDEWYPDYLATMLDFLEKTRSHWVMCPAVRIVLNEKDEEIEKEILHGEPLEQYENLYHAMLRENLVGGPSQTLIRRNVFEKVGLFREDLRVRDDWEMWIRLTGSGCRLSKFSNPLYVYKIRNCTLTKMESHVSLANTYAIITEHAPEAFTVDPSFRQLYAEMLWDVARHMIQLPKKDIGLILKCLLKSELYDPSSIRFVRSLKSVFSMQGR